ncbi:alpha/beta hydrolase family protein [Bradyrhizobium sp.]|uniref:alpha/beta hydrolase family protein n=1 Tax=Bradyrhizobium sp. TaxID=376 RepID=UPI003BAE644A
MMSRLALLMISVLAVAANASVSPAEPIATPGETPPVLQEETWVLPLALPSIAYVIRPAGKGPFPLAIMNHGVAMDPKERSFFPLIEFRDAALWFARRGYLVVAPAGPGYGAAGLDIPERGLYGAFFSKIGKCTNPNFRDAGLAIARYDLSTIRYLTEQGLIVPNRTIVVGQSAGGWGSIALASQNPSGVKAVVVFAAGRGGRVDGKPNNNCAPGKLVAATAEFGRTARVPMLWIYTRNDSYFGPDLSTRMHEAFVSAGGNAEYHLLDPFGTEGHSLIDASEGVRIWSPLVSQFLERQQ